MAEFKINVNGTVRTVNVDPETPLLWVLRDELGLTGSKYGCGIGSCGACTVLVGNDSQRSCSLPVSEVGSGKVTTIEGLSPDGAHPLQKAWVETAVPACGYCQSGQIMEAAALLKKKPQPTEADIREAMEGNLCRCGTYQRIRDAVMAASKGSK